MPKPNYRAEKGFKLPENPTTTERVYVCVPVPNDPTHIDNFWGALWELTRWFNYKKDDVEPHAGKLAADVWRDIFVSIDLGDDCTMPCCPETNALLLQLQTLTNQNLAYQLELADNGTPQSFAPNAPNQWDAGTAQNTAGQLRGFNALCNAIKAYIAWALWQQALGIAAGASVLGAIADHFLGHPDRVIPALPFSIPEVVQTITVELLDGIVNDAEAIDRVACCMKKAFRGNEVNFDTFKVSAQSCGFSFPNNDAQLAGIVNGFNQNEANYRAFVRMLVDQRAQASDTENQCGCCDDSWNWLFDNNYFSNGYVGDYTPPTFERTGENQITIHTFEAKDNTNPDATQRGFRIYAPAGCCFKVRIVSPSVPWVPPAPNGYNVVWIDRSADDSCGSGYNVDLSQFWCTNLFEMRWGSGTLAHPAGVTTQDFVLEFDDMGC